MFDQLARQASEFQDSMRDWQHMQQSSSDSEDSDEPIQDNKSNLTATVDGLVDSIKSLQDATREITANIDKVRKKMSKLDSRVHLLEKPELQDLPLDINHLRGLENDVKAWADERFAVDHDFQKYISEAFLWMHCMQGSR